MNENPLKTKSYAFALGIVKLYKYLALKRRNMFCPNRSFDRGPRSEQILLKAIESKLDFVHKLSIALKEADETEYWINLLCDGDFITRQQADSLLADCLEIQKMLTSSIKTAKKSTETTSQT